MANNPPDRSEIGQMKQQKDLSSKMLNKTTVAKKPLAKASALIVNKQMN